MTFVSASDAHVELTDVHMAYDDREVFSSLSCRFPRERISVILGGSGSGKSTILRLVGGLVRPDRGRIEVIDTDITRLSHVELNHVRRKLGMLFQGGALLDSMTVFENLAFPLREHATLGEDEIAAEVRERLQAVGLSDADDLLPSQLSGGMVKRVGLARAIMMNPVILLCDEPMSGLDPVTARRIEALLVDMNRERHMTLIVVSHHIPSTLRIADHCVLLVPGRGAVEGKPTELRHHPDPAIASFFDEEGLSAPGEVERAPVRAARPRGTI
jgi:phospholipid/cholesterol/gamma-HCH transport system ATP-binding protein